MAPAVRAVLRESTAMEESEFAEHEVAQVRIELSHGVVQLLCNSSGVDSLHIKGLALAPELRYPGRAGMDVDLLVRPSHIDQLHTALRGHGWLQVGRFATGSPFEHAENWHHETLGYLDLHRLIPGIGLAPDDAFRALWASRTWTALADVECAVPDRDAQALVVLLHAARSHGDRRGALDTDQVWRTADAGTQQRILDLVDSLRAEVAFAAAVGELEDFRDRPDYLLWKVNSSPNAARTTEWWARIRAASGPRRKASLAVRSLLVNRDHLRTQRDHEPSRADVAREFVRRAMLAAREIIDARRSR